MKKSNSVLLTFFGLFVSLFITSCNENPKESTITEASIIPMTQAELEDEAWHMEELYWEYVQKIDTVAYKALWHADFMGYPGFGDGVSDVSKIASWIPDLHKDPDLKYSYQLHKKGSNAIEDVVMVFYDTDYFWTDKDNQIVKKTTQKFTHTWKKLDGKWVILGGMAAEKKSVSP